MTPLVAELAKWFPVRPGERRLTGVLALQNLLIVGAFIGARSARDALFLAEQSASALARMYLWQAGAVGLFGLLYAPFARRLRQDRAAMFTALLFAAGFVAFHSLQGHGPWVNAALYVYVELVGALTVMQFWSFTNELFHARDAKRLFGLVGAGGVAANIAVGLITHAVASRYGATHVLLVSALLLTGYAGVSAYAAALGRQRRIARAAKKTVPADSMRKVAARHALGTRHLQLVAVLVFLTFVATTFADFGFKAAAAQQLSRDEMAAYFGSFHAWTGVIALGLQLFGTHRVLSRLGIVLALTLLPGALGVGALGLALFPGLLAATAVRGADTVLRYSVHDATVQLLYMPLTASGRAGAKAFIEGTIKPVGIGVAGVLLLLYVEHAGVRIAPLALALSAVCALWLGLIFRLKGRYVQSLQDTLGQGRVGWASGGGREALPGSPPPGWLDALKSADPDEVLGALQLLRTVPGHVDVDHKVEALLEHGSPEVRKTALTYFSGRQTVRFANSVFRLFEDPDAGVRAAAVETFCLIGRDRAVRSVRGHLDDETPEVRRAAITGMIRYGGLDGVLAAAEALKALIRHPDPSMREQAAQALGDMGVRNFYQPVLELMADSEPAVRKQAIRAAAQLQSSEFLLPLVQLTGERSTAHDAVEALSAYGTSVVETLGKVLANPLEAPAVRVGAARVLERVATREALSLIVGQLQVTHEALRTRMARALARACQGEALAASERQAVLEALSHELQDAFETEARAWALGLLAPLPPQPASPLDEARLLLRSALQEKLHNVEHRVFLLLSALYPEADVGRIQQNLHAEEDAEAGRRRANALELLEQLLPSSEHRLLVPLLEDTLLSERRPGPSALHVAPTPLPSPKEALTRLARDGNGWIRSCTLHLAALLPETLAEADGLLEQGTHDADPLVRETALTGMQRRAPRRARQLAYALLQDEAGSVRARAALIDSLAGR